MAEDSMTIKERADAEADRAEAESPDEADAEAEAEAEQAPATEPPAEETSPEAQSAEAQAKALDKEMTRHERALRKVLDVDEPLRDAPYDGVIGFLVPGALEYQPNEKFKACPTCNGMGDVLTGGQKQGQELAPCPRCAGRSYLEKQDRVEQPTGPVSQAGESNGQEDEYGIPAWMGNPDISTQPPPIPTS